MSSVERQVLLAPDAVARAASNVVRGRVERWMLRQPRSVRRSYVFEVLAHGDDRELREQRWMLLQPDAVRVSYVTEVLEGGEPRA
jgi:hypothetical protein